MLSFEFLEYNFLSNSIKDYSLALFAFLFFFIFFKAFQGVIVMRLKKIAQKTKTNVDDVLIKIVQSIKSYFYLLLAIYFALFFLNISDVIQKIITAFLSVSIIYQVVLAFQILLDYVIAEKLKKEKQTESKTAIILIKKIIKWVLWSIGSLMVLSNLGVNINSLVAGLGVGGIAVAIALQNILEDLFSSFAIYFDKPFVIGDFIVVGKHNGIVEKIGIKTTRIRSLQGEEIIISNKELTSSRIANFKSMEERRAVFSFGVDYRTSSENLVKVNKIVEHVIDSEPKARFDRVHFVEFGDSSLSFDVIYYVLSSEYRDYRDVHQNILFGIKKSFTKEGISMAFPTQSIYIEKTE